MNREEYLSQLRKYLKRIPKQELDAALEYYTEYFDEAGMDNEQKVIEELGDPKELAKKIIVECVDKNYSKEYEETSEQKNEDADAKQNKKEKGLSPWVILAAVFALPLSPVLVCLIIIGFIFVAVVFLIALAGVVAFGASVISEIAGTIIVGIPALLATPAGGLQLIGFGLILIGFSAILFALFYMMLGAFVRLCKKAGSKLVHKKAGMDR